MFSEDFLNAFLKDYSHEEKEQIKNDLDVIEKFTFYEAKPEKAYSKTASLSAPPVYLATAGGPGSAKTTTLETYIKKYNKEHFVYADPDQISLKNMIFTYRKSLSNYHLAKSVSNHAAYKDAYNQWRGASNFICHKMLQRAFGGPNGTSEQYSIAHGTTSTSPYIESFYQKIKNLGYNISLLLCYSKDETRQKLIKNREEQQAFVQVDPNEVISKGADFPRRFSIYFKYANDMVFYWNDALTHGTLPEPCALYSKLNDEPSITVLNAADWRAFCQQYLDDIKRYKIDICNEFKSFIPKDLLEEYAKKSDAAVLSKVGLNKAPVCGKNNPMTAQLEESKTFQP